MPKKNEFKENPKDTKVRSSGMRSIDYHRYHLKKMNRQAELFATSYSVDEARRRSYMVQSFGNLPLAENSAVLIGKKFKFRTWWEKPEKTPWIVHVKDGKPLTAHGAKLLGVPFA